MDFFHRFYLEYNLYIYIKSILENIYIYICVCVELRCKVSTSLFFCTKYQNLISINSIIWKIKNVIAYQALSGMHYILFSFPIGTHLLPLHAFLFLVLPFPLLHVHSITITAVPLIIIIIISLLLSLLSLGHSHTESSSLKTSNHSLHYT